MQKLEVTGTKNLWRTHGVSYPNLGTKQKKELKTKTAPCFSRTKFLTPFDVFHHAKNLFPALPNVWSFANFGFIYEGENRFLTVAKTKYV